MSEIHSSSCSWNLNFISRRSRHPGKAKLSCNVGAMHSKCKSDSFKSEEMPSWCLSHNRKRGDDQMVFNGGRRVINDLSASASWKRGVASILIDFDLIVDDVFVVNSCDFE